MDWDWPWPEPVPLSSLILTACGSYLLTGEEGVTADYWPSRVDMNPITFHNDVISEDVSDQWDGSEASALHRLGALPWNGASNLSERQGG